MRQDGFSYVVRAELVFTSEEVAALKQCSEAHYDYKCKGVLDQEEVRASTEAGEASKQGGLVYGMGNYFAQVGEEDSPVPRPFTSRELNLLLKVCEMAWPLDLDAGKHLFHKLKLVFDRVQEEQRRLQGAEEILRPFHEEVTL